MVNSVCWPNWNGQKRKLGMAQIKELGPIIILTTMVGKEVWKYQGLIWNAKVKKLGPKEEG